MNLTGLPMLFQGRVSDLVLYIVQSTLLVAVALALRTLVAGKVPRSFIRGLWVFVCARLLFVAPIELSVPLTRLVGGAPLSFGFVGSSGGADLTARIWSIDGMLDQVWVSSRASVTALCFAWFCVAVGLIICVVAMYVRTLRRLDTGFDADDPVALEWLDRIGLRRQLHIHWGTVSASPATYGWLRPVIVLPVGFSALPSSERILALEHELVHIKHFDMPLKLAFCCAVCLQWFNPFAWAAYRFAIRDIEIACDERVLGDADAETSRFVYASLLLDMFSPQQRQPFVASLGATALETRVRLVLRPPSTRCRTARIVPLATSIAIVALAVILPATAYVGRIVATDSYAFLVPDYWENIVDIAVVDGDTTISARDCPDLLLIAIRTMDNVSPDSALQTAPGTGIALQTSDGTFVEISVFDNPLHATETYRVLTNLRVV